MKTGTKEAERRAQREALYEAARGKKDSVPGPAVSRRVRKPAAELADDGGGTIAPHGECAYCDRRRASNSDGARRRRRGEVV